MNKISKRSILICGENIEYTLKKNRGQKNIILKVRNGEVIVSAPRLALIYVIEKLILEKSEWIVGVVKKTKPVSSKITFDEKVLDNLKSVAFDLVQERLEFFNNHYKFKYKKVTIRAQKTRWGSCSSNKNLSFNVKILILPKYLQDYIVVHELCHLREMNHSQKFWSLVEKKIPNQKELRKELKKYHV